MSDWSRTSKYAKHRRHERDPDDIADGISYDRYGRMDYHPEFHWNHKKRMTLDEKIYIAKYFDIDGARLIALALGRTDKAILFMAEAMKKSGEFDRLKEMSLDEWEQIINRSEENEGAH